MAGVAQQMTLGEMAVWADRTGQSIANKDYSEPFQVCAGIIARHTKENFEGGHDPQGNAWLPLKHPRSKKGDATPLRDKGLLMGSTQAGGAHVQQISSNVLITGSNLEYAAIHNYGGTITMPERQGTAVTTKKRGESRRLFARRTKATMKKLQTRTYHFIVPSYTITIPQRQFAGWNQTMVKECVDVLAEFALAGV